jgi:DHA1 family bicyclomycin/chloramphenicol resistance-like MFS transporter
MEASASKVLLLCFIAALFSPIGVDIYIALIPEISNVYKENAEYGLSTFILGMGFGTLLAGALYDHLGGRKTLIISTSILLAFICLMIVIDSFAALMINRFFQGVAVSGVSLSAMSIIKDNLPQDQVGSTYGKINGVMNLIPAVFPPVSVLLLSVTGAWQSVFVLFAAITFSLLLFTYSAFTPTSLSWKQTDHDGFKDAFKLSGFSSHFKNSMFRNHFSLPVTSLAIIFMMCTFLPTLLVETYGWSINEFSMYFGFNGLLMFLTGSFLGKLFVRYGADSVLRLGLYLALISAFILVTCNPSSAFGVLAGISMYCVSFIFIIASSHALALSDTVEGVGKANSIISMSQMFLGAALSALSVMFVGASMVYIFSFFVFLLVLQGVLFTWRFWK